MSSGTVTIATAARHGMEPVVAGGLPVGRQPSRTSPCMVAGAERVRRGGNGE